MERQCVKTGKTSSIVSDSNDWTIETINNSCHPLELLLSAITANLETMKIIRALPRLAILE